MDSTGEIRTFERIRVYKKPVKDTNGVQKGVLNMEKLIMLIISNTYRTISKV